MNTALRRSLASLLGTILIVFSVKATGGVLYEFNSVYSGSSVSQGAPWLEAAFQDDGPNQVLLTISGTDLTTGNNPEFLGELDFNFNPNTPFNVNDLSFAFQSGSSGVTPVTPNTGEDAYKADGDGYYDINFNFKNNSSFQQGDSLTYLITTAPGTSLSAADFAYESTSSGGTSGPFYAAAHLQGGTGGFSAWVEPTGGPMPIPVPEPSLPVLLSVLSAVLMLFRSAAPRTV